MGEALTFLGLEIELLGNVALDGRKLQHLEIGLALHVRLGRLLGENAVHVLALHELDPELLRCLALAVLRFEHYLGELENILGTPPFFTVMMPRSSNSSRERLIRWA